MSKPSLIESFYSSFSARPNKTAISFFRGDRLESQLSYSDLMKEANRVARGFASMGIAKGDRVILYCDKSLLFVVAYLALQNLGAIAVPLNPGFKEKEMTYLLNDADPALVVCGPNQEAMVKGINARLQTLVFDPTRRYEALDLFPTASTAPLQIDLNPGDAALIIYTSGTTGNPKGAVLTQWNLIHDGHNIIDIWEISESDVLCHALPLFHVHGLCFALHTALLAGAHVVMMDLFSPKAVIAHLTRNEGEHVCSLFMAVPQMYAKLIGFMGEKRYNFDHMRLWTSGSAPLLVSDFTRIREVFGKEPVEREGMSETGMNFSNPCHGKRKPGTIGLPFPRLQVRIVNPDTFEDVAPGEVGELWLQGPSITAGYWRKPEETAKAFRDGWFRTGDLGKVDEEGYYYITDRLKHIIISGGENISPKEIQGVINQMDNVVESAVVGVPDRDWGEKVVAAVVAAADHAVSPDEIGAHCRAHLHDWKCPKEIRLVAELPRNTMGKVLNEQVRRIFLEERG